MKGSGRKKTIEGLRERHGVLHIVHHFTEVTKEGGGVPRAVLDLVALLAAAGEEVTLVTAADSALPTDWIQGEVPNLHCVFLDRLSNPMQRLPRARLRPAADVLQSAGVLHLHGLWRPRNAQLARLAGRLGTPYIVSPHGMLKRWGMARRSWRKRIYYRLFERRTLREARVVHFAARRERDDAYQWLPHERLTEIPLPLDLRPYEDLPGRRVFEERHPEISDRRPAVLMLGRIHPVKRPEMLVDALGLLHEGGIDCQILFAGAGEAAYVNRLRHRAATRGVADRTHFLGLVLGLEKLSLYQRAEILALPSAGENFGLVLFESMACGTPVLATRKVDTWPDIEASGGGRIVGETAEALADGVASLLADDASRERMGRAGREWAFRHFDAGSLIARYRTMYEDAVRG